VALAGSCLLVGGCRPRPRDPLVTFYNAEFGLSVRHPASWKTEQAAQEGIWYRYFLGPPMGKERKPAVSVTLLAGPLAVPLEEYAQIYLAGNTLISMKPDARPGAQGKAYEFATSNGKLRHALLLLEEKRGATKQGPAGGSWVYGLYSQGDNEYFEQHRALIDEMMRSLTLERPALYPEQRNQELGFAVRVPPSFRSTRRFSGGGSSVEQYQSPALGADRDQTVHGTLSISVDPPPADGRVATYRQSIRQKLGENFQLVSHAPWRDGYVDVMAIDTQLASSRIKRFYRVSGTHGYSLICEARDDVFMRLSGWCDSIAETFDISSAGR
jgi:hypothetical protein